MVPGLGIEGQVWRGAARNGIDVVAIRHWQAEILRAQHPNIPVIEVQDALAVLNLVVKVRMLGALGGKHMRRPPCLPKHLMAHTQGGHAPV